MALAIEFPDTAVALTCNSSARVDHEWGAAGVDVRQALCVLAASSTLVAYINHPNVTHEGDRTVFHGRSVDVMIALTAIEGPPPGVSISQIDVRVRVIAT